MSTAGCRRSRKDQPGVPGWEKRPGCDLLWPEALLWQYLSGAAVCGFWLSVAPSLWAQGGTAQTWSALLHYRGGPGSWRWHQHGKGSGAGLFVNLSHIHWPCHTRKSFSKVFFLVFLNPAAENSKTKKKKKDKYGSCDKQVWWHFLDLGIKTRNKPWSFELFSCFYCLFLQLGFIFQKRMH